MAGAAGHTGGAPAGSCRAVCVHAACEGGVGHLEPPEGSGTGAAAADRAGDAHAGGEDQVQDVGMNDERDVYRMYMCMKWRWKCGSRVECGEGWPKC